VSPGEKHIMVKRKAELEDASSLLIGVTRSRDRSDAFYKSDFTSDEFKLI